MTVNEFVFLRDICRIEVQAKNRRLVRRDKEVISSAHEEVFGETNMLRPIESIGHILAGFSQYASARRTIKHWDDSRVWLKTVHHNNGYRLQPRLGL